MSEEEYAPHESRNYRSSFPFAQIRIRPVIRKSIENGTLLSPLDRATTLLSQRDYLCTVPECRLQPGLPSSVVEPTIILSDERDGGICLALTRPAALAADSQPSPRNKTRPEFAVVRTDQEKARHGADHGSHRRHRGSLGARICAARQDTDPARPGPSATHLALPTLPETGGAGC